MVLQVTLQGEDNHKELRKYSSIFYTSLMFVIENRVVFLVQLRSITHTVIVRADQISAIHHLYFLQNVGIFSLSEWMRRLILTLFVYIMEM